MLHDSALYKSTIDIDIKNYTSNLKTKITITNTPERCQHT